MWPQKVLFSSCLILCISASDDDFKTLKDDIKEVAVESRHLADELADMLLAMEVVDIKEKEGANENTNDGREIEEIIELVL